MSSELPVMMAMRALRPTVRNRFDKIAVAVHAFFVANGYVLTATGPEALSETAFSNTSTEKVTLDHWNELEDEYAFVYTNPFKNGKKVLVKCLVINDFFTVDALSQGSSEPAHLEINVRHYAGDDSRFHYYERFKNIEKLVRSLNAEIFMKLEAPPGSSSSRNSPSVSGYGVGVPSSKSTWWYARWAPPAQILLNGSNGLLN